MGKPLSACSVEELNGKAKSIRVVFTILVGVMGLFLAYVIYKISQGDELNAGLLVPMISALICCLAPLGLTLGKLKKEIKSRQGDSDVS